MTESRFQRGQKAESLAVEYLQGKGYRLIKRNHRGGGGEIDIIAWHADILCFVEVRAVSSLALWHPLETITLVKQRRISQAAQDFLNSYQGLWSAVRFDALGIYLSTPPQFTLLQEAFETP